VLPRGGTSTWRLPSHSAAYVGHSNGRIPLLKLAEFRDLWMFYKDRTEIWPKGADGRIRHTILHYIPKNRDRLSRLGRLDGKFPHCEMARFGAF
jgi:hypothetical protein